MNFIQVLRSNTLYFLISLPLLIILYELFLTVSLGNRNIIILILGQAALVPFLSFIILLMNKFMNNWYGTIGWLVLSAFFIYSSYFIFNNYSFSSGPLTFGPTVTK